MTTDKSAGDSRIAKQRAASRTHRNRKIEDKPYHDTTRPYPEVAVQIEGAITGFKAEGTKDPDRLSNEQDRAFKQAVADAITGLDLAALGEGYPALKVCRWRRSSSTAVIRCATSAHPLGQGVNGVYGSTFR
jgi:hypothetical protein